MRQEMLRQTNQRDTWYQFTPIDLLITVFGPHEAKYFRSRAAKGVRSKTIYTTQSETLRQELETESSQYISQIKFVSPAKFTSTCGMTIFDHRVAIGSFSDNIGGVIIDSKPISQMMEEVFQLIWEKY